MLQETHGRGGRTKEGRRGRDGGSGRTEETGDRLEITDRPNRAVKIRPRAPVRSAHELSFSVPRPRVANIAIDKAQDLLQVQPTHVLHKFNLPVPIVNSIISSLDRSHGLYSLDLVAPVVLPAELPWKPTNFWCMHK